MLKKLAKVERAKRKTVSLQIKDDGTLLVKAPFRISDAYIRDLINKKSNWIDRTRKTLLKQRRETPVNKFISGEFFYFLGKKYILKISNQARGLTLEQECFLLSESMQARAKKNFTNWYRKKARLIIKERVEHYTKLLRLTYKQVRITSAVKRWGSCSWRGNLNFPFRLIMTPIDIIDYVIIHEVCHLIEGNHSQRFWRQVALACPDYQEKRKWLKTNGHLFNL